MPAGFTDPTMLNGPGVRLVIAKMDRIASRHQTILIDNVCNPTWGYVIGDAIARGELPDIEGWEKHSWTTPKRITVDAGREAANDRADVEMGLLSMSEIYSQRGMDFREEMTRRVEDMKYIMDLSRDSGVPMWMLYKPNFNWLQQGMKQNETPDKAVDELGINPDEPNTPQP
jgi:hypothetical protein